MVKRNSLNLNDEERKALEKFREKFKDLLKPHHDDRFLLRWLRARRFNLENAEKMLREDFKFRERWRSDSMIDHYQLKKGLEEYEPMVFLGFGKMGHGVRLFNYGGCDFKGWCKCISLSDFMRYTIFHMEMDWKRIQENNLKTGLYAETLVFVLDCKDSRTHHFYDRTVFKSLIHILSVIQDHYPERLHSVIMTNVPTLFYYVWNLILPVLDPVVKNKVSLYGNDGWHDQLFSLVPKEIIPAYLGGDRRGPGNDPYCSDLLNWKFPVPSSLYATDSRLKRSDPGVRERVLRPHSSFELTFDVKESGSSIHWDFQTNKNDIRFALHYREDDDPSKAKDEILPLESIECCLIPEKGSYVCERTGKYTLLFDNGYSWFTSKKLLYKIEALPPNVDNGKDTLIAN